MTTSTRIGKDTTASWAEGWDAVRQSSLCPPPRDKFPSTEYSGSRITSAATDPPDVDVHCLHHTGIVTRQALPASMNSGPQRERVLLRQTLEAQRVRTEGKMFDLHIVKPD